jgi:DNA-binding transcriptional LysR family regulator
MLDRDIAIFRAVMTSGSATRAARLLDMSQPAVSLALRRLEKHAGVTLFERTAARLKPTQEAAALLVEVERHFVGLDLIEHRIRTLKQFGAGRVRIASFPGLGLGFLPRVLADLSAQRERSLISLQIMGSHDVRNRVLRGEAELGLVADDVSTGGLEHALFAHYFGIVALPAGHPLARAGIVTPKQLATHPFIALNPDDAVSIRLDTICRRHGVQLRTVVETPYTVSQCEMVRNRMGIAIVNPVTACDYLHGGLVFRPFSERLDFTALTVWPAGQSPSLFVRALLAGMRKRLEADMDSLRAQMPVGAGVPSLHQFQGLEQATGPDA